MHVVLVILEIIGDIVGLGVLLVILLALFLTSGGRNPFR